MKKLLLITTFTLLGINAYAAGNEPTSTELLNTIVKQHPDFVDINEYSSYTADGDNDYVGRNENRVRETYNQTVNTGSGISKSTSVNNGTKVESDIENLETSAGEMVQKVEDDRLQKSKFLQDVFDENKRTLSDVHSTLSQVNINNLGSEQDPKVKHPFKCNDLEACNKNPSMASGSGDSNSINGKECAVSSRLYYDGSKWDCKAVFVKIPAISGCKSDQYTQLVSGGIVCVDYIYIWSRSEYGVCIGGQRTRSVNCVRKKNYASGLYESVSDESKCLGLKPKTSIPC